MANYSIKADLLKVKGAFLTNIKGKTATKQCVCIPVEGSGLYAGAKGVYLNLTAVELREPKYEESHLVKQTIGSDEYRAMSEEERRAIPVLGGMRELTQQDRASVLKEASAQSVAQVDGEADDLPF